MTTDPLIRQQLFSYIIYTTLGIIYGLFGTSGAGTSGILVIPIILFSIVVFLYNLGFIFLGQLLFGQDKYLLIALLTPQIIALVILVTIKTQSKYILDFDFDKVLFGFLIITTILNIWTFIKLKRKVER